MTKKTSGQQSSSMDKDRLDGFRQRLPQRDETRDNIDAIKARMAAAKSDLNISVKTRLERVIPTPPPASDLTSDTVEPSLIAEDNIQPEIAPEPTAIAQQDKPSGTAEEFETNDGFQIFKSRSVPQKPVITDLPEQIDRDEQMAVEPVPMAPDAIEDALKLIEEEDQSDFAMPEKSAVGFTPSNLIADDDKTPDLPIGDFGTPAASNQNQIDDLNASDDDLELAAALSAELSAESSGAPHINNESSHDETNHAGPTAPVSVLGDDHRRNIEIGQNVASSIKSIIRDEVDETLDRIARQAVSDALKSHRAL